MEEAEFGNTYLAWLLIDAFLYYIVIAHLLCDKQVMSGGASHCSHEILAHMTLVMTRGETEAPTSCPSPQYRSEKLPVKSQRLPDPHSPHLGVYLIIPGCNCFYIDSPVTCALASH